MAARSSSSFSRYLPPTPGSEPWGLAVTAGGATPSPRGASYPPRRHPADHVFTWEHGRVLDAWQLVFIRRGQGHYESRVSGPLRIAAGDVFIVFPGVWHRYAPDPATGWDELWVEMQGPTLRRLTATGVLAAERPRITPADATPVRHVFSRLHARLRTARTGFDSVSAGLGLQLLGLLHETSQSRSRDTPIDLAVHRAEIRLAADLDQPRAIPALAAELGFAYSYFRRAFKQRTGLSPLDYRLRLRLDRARRLLGTTHTTLETIAETLGFSSAYHLSTAFKKTYGVSPRAWRQGNRNPTRLPASSR